MLTIELRHNGFILSQHLLSDTEAGSYHFTEPFQNPMVVGGILLEAWQAAVVLSELPAESELAPLERLD